MSMSKRFQIPSNDEDQKLYREAAKRAKLSAAEWARRILRAQAQKDLKKETFADLLDELATLGPSEIELPTDLPPEREIEPLK